MPHIPVKYIPHYSQRAAKAPFIGELAAKAV